MSFRRADADSWRRKGAEGAAGGRPGTMANTVEGSGRSDKGAGRFSRIVRILSADRPGITGSVSIPARAALELHQTGMDIFEPLGWAEQDAADTAAMGQELEVPLFRLIRGWTLRRSTP